jgi:hypothetical protein
LSIVNLSASKECVIGINQAIFWTQTGITADWEIRAAQDVTEAAEEPGNWIALL